MGWCSSQNYPASRVRWNQLYVVGKTVVPRAAGTTVDIDVEWCNTWFLVGLVPADQVFRSWEADLRLGFHLYGPQLWALSGPQDFGRGTFLGGEGIDGNKRGAIRLRIILGHQRGAAFLIDCGKGWKLLRDTPKRAEADSCPIQAGFPDRAIRYRPARLPADHQASVGGDRARVACVLRGVSHGRRAVRENRVRSQHGTLRLPFHLPRNDI